MSYATDTDYIVYIPTRNRLDKQFTYDLLKDLPFLKNRLFLVVHPSEAEEHIARGRQIIVRPEGQIHHIWEYMRNRTEDPDLFFIMDDDLSFFRRISDDPEEWGLRKLTPDDIPTFNELFSNCLTKMIVDGYIHGTLDSRQGNAFKAQPDFEVGRANAFHFFNRPEIAETGLDMGLSGLHDIHTTLHLLERGEPNIVISNFCWDQRRGSNAPGGCSTYRDPVWQAEEVHKLKVLHPKTIKVVEKTPKGGWGDGFKTRTDVRVSWQKAYNLGRIGKEK